MTAADQPSMTRTDAHSPASFLAAAATLAAIDDALRDAQRETPDATAPGPEQALGSLMLLRQVREQLAGWETGLIETARDAGASWADLAPPLGVASRQAAERRYLRGRPGAVGTTGEQRVTATRQARAAERATVSWARANAGDLRRLAGQITALAHLAPEARSAQAALHAALGAADAAELIAPLTGMRPYLDARHTGLVQSLEAIEDRHTTTVADDD
ncbi:type III effector protein [Streptomyces sp. NP-1717]|uniref:type III effector protein n=1 Tax=unclassified Streptomyces TaxID=2593676 RepID=UPI001F5CB4F3|nr:type III effector protein [Streptomyces sp. NP-1717]MCI3220727.1 type III effector protein [Streptomyces sp. NP-1717]WTA77749.1 type III effector protein [Streptomyces sp. NBC_00838]